MPTEPMGQPTADAHRGSGSDLPRRPTVLIFDVNETLSDMSPMRQRFEDVGAPRHLVAPWFAGLLRDGFALTALDACQPFARLASESLLVGLDGVDLNRSTEDAVRHIMDGFSGLPVHPDVSDGVRALRGVGLRLVTLSNGATSVAEGLLDRAGIRDQFEALLSVEGAGIWKPAAGAYAYALQQCGVEPAEVMLVAVHPWDTDGASRAGLATAWLNRDGGRYPDYFREPDVRVRSLTDLADRLG